MKKLILFISLIISSFVHSQCYNGNITLLTQQDVDNFSVNYPGIDCINGLLTIGTNSVQNNITNISALENLASANGIYIRNTLLTHINGFQNLNSCNSVSIDNNNSLQDISGFSSLTNMSSIYILGNSNLLTINGFQNLATIGLLSIKNAQINILNFQNLQAATSINLDNTNNISGFTGLTNLTSLQQLTIYNNSSPIDFTTINPTITLNTLIIETCNNINTLNGLNFASAANTISLKQCSTLSNINAINTVNTISQLTLSNLPALQNLSALSNLTSVSSVIYLISLNGLTSLSGLENLTSSNMLSIIGNNNLMSISALNHLTSTPGSLNINGNSSLTSLSGLENLTSIGYLYITSNLLITNLNAFNHPISITNNLTITGNQNLSNCSAQSICNYLNAPTGVVTILNNNSAIGCNSAAEITADCSVPRTKIRTQDCGLQTTTFNQLFYCNSITGATYEFRYRDISTNAVSTKTRVNTAASFGDAGLLDINRTYSVRVRAKLNGVYGNYGDSCLIYSPTQVPLTKIRTQDCGLQTTTFNQLFYADVVTYSTGNYDFEFTDIATNIVTIKSRPNNIASLGDAGLFELNKTYSVRVRTKVGNNWGNYGPACLIYSPTQVPLTKIRTQDCGLQTTTFNQLFYADVVTYSTGNYDFEFTDIATNIVTIKSRPNNIASLGDAGLFELNKTYSVRVRTKVGNNWGNYGTACLIYSPTQVPLTKIRTQDCGLQTTTFIQLYYADAVSYATNYEFEYVDINTNAITYRVRLNNAASLGDAGLNQYNKIYNVRVRAKVGNNWGAFGTVCQIKSPINVPVTQINSSYCNLFYTLDGEFSCDPVTNANAYEFEFTNTVTNSITSNIVAAEFNSFFASSLPFYDKIYSVRVRARIGTTWGSYGTSCILKSNSMEFQRLKSGDESSSADSKIESLIKIYPNPTTDVLNITELTEPSIINVFNVSGQLVLTKSSAESNEKIDLSYLDSGIYMIVIEGKNGEIAKRQRVVLAK